jgi:hypothetical protein
MCVCVIYRLVPSTCIAVGMVRNPTSFLLLVSVLSVIFEARVQFVWYRRDKPNFVRLEIASFLIVLLYVS